jgi:hypothetical protein
VKTYENIISQKKHCSSHSLDYVCIEGTAKFALVVHGSSGDDKAFLELNTEKRNWHITKAELLLKNGQQLNIISILYTRKCSFALGLPRFFFITGYFRRNG